MKRDFMAAALLSLLLILSSCGGSGSSTGGDNPPPPTQPQLSSGNWSLHSSSQVGPVGTVYIGGNLDHSGTSITGVMHIANSSCFDVATDVPFTGTSNGSNVTLASASISGQVISVTGTIINSKSMTGTYTITGGCAAGDRGSITGTFVPSISGTWKATEAVGAQTLTTTAVITQRSTPAAIGVFPLTGSISFSGATASGCFSGGTLDALSFIAGDIVAVLGNMDGQGGGTGQLIYVGFIDNPAAPTKIEGVYDAESSRCSLSSVPLTFTKQ
jgi:hypothetical protein